MLMKKSNDIIGNRNRDLPACSAVIDQSSISKLFSHGNCCVNFLEGESQILMYVNCTKVFPICSNLSHFIKESSRTTLSYILCGPIFTPVADKLTLRTTKPADCSLKAKPSKHSSGLWYCPYEPTHSSDFKALNY